MNSWYECKVRYQKITDEGTIKSSQECYLIDAYTVTEAEARLIEEITPFTSNGEFTVSSIKKEKLTDLFLSEDPDATYLYRCKVNFISIDEKKGVEKRVPATMIVKASSVLEAAKRIEKEMASSISEWQIASVSETNIVDILWADGQVAAKSNE